MHNFQYAIGGCWELYKKVMSKKTCRIWSWNFTIEIYIWQNGKIRNAMLNLAKRAETSWTLNLEIISVNHFQQFLPT